MRYPSALAIKCGVPDVRETMRIIALPVHVYTRRRPSDHCRFQGDPRQADRPESTFRMWLRSSRLTGRVLEAELSFLRRNER